MLEKFVHAFNRFGLKYCICKALLFVFPHSFKLSITAALEKDLALSRMSFDEIKEEMEFEYEHRTGKHININFPVTFNDKMQWIKLYDTSELKTKLADKYLVRQWVADKIGKEFLVPILGIWNSANEIDFSLLPNQFCLKANHGSGMNYIVKDKSKLSKIEMKTIKRLLSGWMQYSYYTQSMEFQYKDIPRKIIAEEYLSCLSNVPEFQFWCFNGEPRFVSVIQSPHGKNEKLTFDMEWKELPFITSLPKYNNALVKPLKFEEMIKLAKKLCEGFVFVRVDFYYCNEHIYFGEMTFSPAAGICNWYPSTYDAIIGKMLNLPF